MSSGCGDHKSQAQKPVCSRLEKDYRSSSSPQRAQRDARPSSEPPKQGRGHTRYSFPGRFVARCSSTAPLGVSTTFIVPKINQKMSSRSVTEDVVRTMCGNVDLKNVLLVITPAVDGKVRPNRFKVHSYRLDNQQHLCATSVSRREKELIELHHNDSIYTVVYCTRYIRLNDAARNTPIKAQIFETVRSQSTASRSSWYRSNSVSLSLRCRHPHVVAAQRNQEPAGSRGRHEPKIPVRTPCHVRLAEPQAPPPRMIPATKPKPQKIDEDSNQIIRFGRYDPVSQAKEKRLTAGQRSVECETRDILTPKLGRKIIEPSPQEHSEKRMHRYSNHNVVQHKRRIQNNEESQKSGRGSCRTLARRGCIGKVLGPRKYQVFTAKEKRVQKDISLEETLSMIPLPVKRPALPIGQQMRQGSIRDKGVQVCSCRRHTGEDDKYNVYEDNRDEGVDKNGVRTLRGPQTMCLSRGYIPMVSLMPERKSHSSILFASSTTFARRMGTIAAPDNFSRRARDHLERRLLRLDMRKAFNKFGLLVEQINAKYEPNSKHLLTFFQFAEILDFQMFVRRECTQPNNFPGGDLQPEPRYLLECYIFDDRRDHMGCVGMLCRQLHQFSVLCPKAADNMHFVDNAFDLTQIPKTLTNFLKGVLCAVHARGLYDLLGELALEYAQPPAALLELNRKDSAKDQRSY